jgi:formiminotetrahydrofolate cyclodeaminase
MLAEMTLEKFLEDLGSRLPAPGGGAAAALAAALGAALVSMVCNLTIGKKQYAPYEKELLGIKDDAQQLQKSLLILMEDDALAFGSLMDSFKLPAHTEAEKTARASRIQADTCQAAEVPAKIAESCLHIAELLDKLAGRSNKNLESDIKVALDMAEAGLNSAVTNIKVNLPGIEDRQFVSAKQEFIKKVTGNFQDRKTQIGSKLTT